MGTIGLEFVRGLQDWHFEIIDDEISLFLKVYSILMIGYNGIQPNALGHGLDILIEDLCVCVLKPLCKLLVCYLLEKPDLLLLVSVYSSPFLQLSIAKEFQVVSCWF